jgi:cytochrome P450
MEARALEAIREERDMKKSKIVELAHRRSPGEKHAVYWTLLHDDGLPPHEKVYNRISHEAVTLMAAGGDTTASALMMAAYFIICDGGRILSRLIEEVQSVMSNGVTRPPVAELERLPYLVRYPLTYLSVFLQEFLAHQHWIDSDCQRDFTH